MDALAAKSDAVTTWECTFMDAYRRLRALIPGAGFACEVRALRVTV